MGKAKLDEFEIDGIGFRLGPLPVLVAERLAPALTAMLTPAVAALFAGQTRAAELGEALRGLSGCAELLPKFREAFAAQSEVNIGVIDGKPVWTELKGQVFEDTFRRQHRRYLEWVSQCLACEYGTFLAEIGQRLVAALEANPSISPNGSPGASGDSPPTPESRTD
jgi:hypothetical protein